MKSLEDIENNKAGKKMKIKRKKFFLYSGAVALGIYASLKIPFNFFQTKQDQKVSSIKITQNPHAVKRKAREVSNG